MQSKAQCLQTSLLSMIAVMLVATAPNQYFDSFLLQARGIDGLDGNATLVGKFVNPLPSISMNLNCLREYGECCSSYCSLY